MRLQDVMKHGTKTKSARNSRRNHTANEKQRPRKRSALVIRPGASIQRASQQTTKAIALDSDSDEESSVEVCRHQNKAIDRNSNASENDDDDDDESSKDSDEEDEIPYKMAFSQTTQDNGDSSSDSDGGYESPSDDDHPNRSVEPLRPGDVVEYYNTMIFTAGSGMGHNTATILGTTPGTQFPLTLSTGEYLLPSVRIRRTHEWIKGTLYKHSGYWKPISSFRLRKRCLRNPDGTRVLVGRQKAFSNLRTTMEEKAVEFLRGDHDHRIQSNTNTIRKNKAASNTNDDSSSESSSSSDSSQETLEFHRSKPNQANKLERIQTKPGILSKPSRTTLELSDSDDDSDNDSTSTLQFKRTKLSTPSAPPMAASRSVRNNSRSAVTKTPQRNAQTKALFTTKSGRQRRLLANDDDQIMESDAHTKKREPQSKPQTSSKHSADSTKTKLRSYGATTVASKRNDARYTDEILLDSDDSDEDSLLLAPVFASKNTNSPESRNSPSDKSNNTRFPSAKPNPPIPAKSSIHKYQSASSTSSNSTNSTNPVVSRATNGFGRPRPAVPPMEDTTIDIFEDSSGDDDSSDGSVYRRRNKRGERILQSPNLYRQQHRKGNPFKSMLDLLKQDDPVKKRNAKPPSPSRRIAKRSVVVTGYQPLAISINGEQPQDDSPPSIMKAYQKREQKRKHALEKENATNGEQRRKNSKDEKESNRRKLQREKKKLKQNHSRPPPYPAERSDPNLAEQSTQENEWSDVEHCQKASNHHRKKQRNELSSKKRRNFSSQSSIHDSEEETKPARKKLTHTRNRTTKSKKRNKEKRKRYELSPFSDDDKVTPQTPWSKDCEIESPFPSTIKIRYGVAHPTTTDKNSSGKTKTTRPDNRDRKQSSVFDFNSQDENEDPDGKFDKRHLTPQLKFAKMNNSSKSKSKRSKTF